MRSGTVENLHDFKGKLDKIKELKIFKKIYAVTLDKCDFIEICKKIFHSKKWICYNTKIRNDRGHLISMTVREKAELIVKDIKKEQGTNPVVIFKQIAKKEYVSIHGPEHHILDGASLLVAYKNAGGEIDLEQALDRLMAEGLRMPGAMCGLWGICGAITSIGAALAIIDGTGPLSTDGTWGNHMQFTSKAIGELGTINGPRCCKRDAMIAFKNGIDYVNAHYGVTLQYEQMQCGFTDFNEQCIKERCPFHE